jgi:hypothetical protein
MEATESLVLALLQAQGYFVTADYKVKAHGQETFGGQSHDIDLDIVAFDSHTNHVTIGEVKSYWGSKGLEPAHIVPMWTEEKGPHRALKIVNDKDGIQEKLWQMVKEQIGEAYDFEYALFVGRINNQEEVKRRLETKHIFGKPVRLVVIRELLSRFIEMVRQKSGPTLSYVNHPTIATILALEEYKMIRSDIPPRELEEN